MRKLWKRAAALVVSAALAGAMLPSAFSEEATDAVEAKLTTMTLREKVGQLFWVRPETLDFSLNPEKKDADADHAAESGTVSGGRHRSF